MTLATFNFEGGPITMHALVRSCLFPPSHAGPTLKVRRPIVSKKYEATINAMYEDPLVQSTYS